jgi:hypothetical protein
LKSSLLKRAEFVDQQAVGILLYDSINKHTTKTNLPFLVTGETFSPWDHEKKDLIDLGHALKELFQKAAIHYKRFFDPFLIRPDVLVTEHGLKVCEVETQPFGFALAIFLQSSYGEWNDLLGLKTNEILKRFVSFWKEYSGSNNGIFIYSEHTERFKGQLLYISKLLKKHGVNFLVKKVDELKKSDYKKSFYRAFYNYECNLDEDVVKFLENKPNIYPRIDNYFEGKYLLADYFYDKKLREKLTKKTISILDKMFFKTWLIKDKPPKDFPEDISEWTDLASIPRSKRNFVVKMAGNHPDASWAKSVMFLHKKSKVQVRQLMRSILDSDLKWIIQPFYGNKKITLTYAKEDFSDLYLMKGRIRITPYYEYSSGDLLNAKVTIRKNTLLIHAASDSINTVVSDD